MLKLLARLVAVLRRPSLEPPTAAENRALHAADNDNRAREAQHPREYPC